MESRFLKMKLAKRVITGRYFYLVFYAVVTLAILGALLSPGAVLTLDIRLGPNVGLSSVFYGLNRSTESVMRLPTLMLLEVINRIFPFWLWEKLLFFSIFFLAGVSAHRLLPSKGLGAYFAGLLYMINPFTYVRFLAGQWAVLAVYALTPFAVKAFTDFLEARNGKSVVRFTLLATLVGTAYQHGFPLLLPVFLIIWLLRITSRRQKTFFVEVLKYTIMAGVVLLVLNAYWLIPFLTAEKSVLQGMSELGLTSFAPRPASNFGVAFAVASMHGFWRGGYIYPGDLLPFWWLFFVFIFFLAVFGFFSFYRDERIGWVISSFAFLWLAGLVLAMGAAGSPTGSVFEWLIRNVPLFGIFRESQKFVAWLSLAYAYLGGVGVDEFVAVLRNQEKGVIRIGITALIALGLITPPLYSFTMFGFYGQLKVTDYPREWYELNEYLDKNKGDFNVLFLPWHEFLSFSWLPNRGDKKLGNPARAFFSKPVIQGDNIEMPGIYSESTNPISGYIEFLLGEKGEISNFGELLAPLNVKYVILVNEADYQTYDFLYQQEDLAVVLRKSGLTLFRNEYFTSRIYGVSNVVSVGSLDEYFTLSQTQDVTGNLYLMEVLARPGFGRSVSESARSIGYNEKSPVKYEVGGTTDSYIIFTLPQNINTDYWEYKGEKPVRNLGFMPAFEASPGGGEIIYTRFYRVYLPAYAISTLALAFSLFLLLKRRRH